MGDNLKRAVRARMARTGETYSTARMRILARRTAREGERRREPQPLESVSEGASPAGAPDR